MIRKVILLLNMLMITLFIQAQTAMLTLPNIPSPNTIVQIPLIVETIDESILIFQMYIEVDPSVLSYIGTIFPHPQLPGAEWTTGMNVNNDEWGGNWLPGDFMPENITPGDTLCIIEFIYLGGSSTLIWGTSNQVKGITEFYSPSFTTFTLTLNNGCVACGPPPPHSILSLNAFLEGPFNDTDMNTSLNPEPIPLSQPYNDPLKWYYQGTVTLDSIPNEDVVDWVLIELRETIGDASTALPDSMIARLAAFILKDGSIVGLDGINPLKLYEEITNNLYVVVYHRNHLPVMSSGPLTATKGTYAWNFTTPSGQAYGTGSQTDLGGVYGMIGGDGNSNGQIDFYDKDSVWTEEAGNATYNFGDFSLDKQADNIDKNDIWELNLDIKNQVPGMLCSPQPDTAEAGPDQLNILTSSTILEANTPDYGTGKWTIISGTGGGFDDENDPTTRFVNIAGNTYELRWMIYTACDMTEDFVSISFDSASWFCGYPEYPLIDDRDGQSYNTVQIGTKCWMAENLNIGTMIINTEEMTDNDTIEKYCVLNDTNKCNTYGGLYQWDEIMEYTNTPGIQGICPTGWYIPTNAEYNVLIDFLGGTSVAGGKMKEAGTVHWTYPNTGATNSSGFTALGSGYRSLNGTFNYYHGLALFWSSNSGSLAGLYRLSSNNTQVYFTYDDKAYGYSVRCIYNFPPDQPSNPSPQNCSTNISTDTILSWTCNDPDGDDLLYDIYLGVDPNPPLIQLNHNDILYNPGTLLYDTTYYWKIIVHDTPGDSTVGDIWSFNTEEQTSPWSCGDLLIDDRDGQYYNTVQVGTQCWMAENLNIGTMIIGSQTNNSIVEKYCYENILSNCSTYGGLYQWDEMMQYLTVQGAQGICPASWHIPTNNEWKILEGTVDNQYQVGDPEWDNWEWRGNDAGLVLKATSGWNYGGSGTDLFGFSALPNGYRYTNGNFFDLGNYGRFWSSSEYSTITAWPRLIDYYHNQIYRSPSGKQPNGFSVRCLQD